MNMKHPWTENDDIVALYLYLYGTKAIQMNMENVAQVKGIPLGSLKMRISNIKAIDTGSGLGNFAKQTLQVYKKFGKYPELELRKVAKL
jgi:hypothetical protein